MTGSSTSTQRGPMVPRECLNENCDVSVVVALNPVTRKWRAYEAADRSPRTQESVGCWVLMSGQAFRPDLLVEELMVRHEITEAAAKELAAGWPWHRPHHHYEKD